MMKNKWSLWEILNKYKISIPIIQRDYVQGLSSKKLNTETGRNIDKIRENFIKDIYDVTVEENNLSLDFIYGYVRNDEIGNQIFIPLDGQQRLTTLYLLHLYLAWKEGQLENEDVASKFLKFEYEVRSSSKEFCRQVINIKDIEFQKDITSIISKIKNKKWYRTEWDNDKTISSMLNMLEAIHDKFKNIDERVFEKLIDIKNPNIYFQFIDIKDLEQDDDLYIKLNVRGKPLTSFENFKASLEEKISTLLNDKRLGEVKMKMDNAWTDLFWKYSKKDIKKLDEYMLNFFEAVLYCNFIIKTEEIIKKQDIFIYLDYINEETIDRIDKFLDKLINKEEKKFTKYTNLYCEDNDLMLVIRKEGNLEYSDYLKFFTFFLGISDENLSLRKNEENLYQWLRVVNNLIENHIYNKEEDFIRSLKSIKKLYTDLDEVSYDILKLFLKQNYKVEGFFGSQVEEEKIKSYLIKLNKDWQYLIEKVENNSYLKGNIGFILEMSGIEFNMQIKKESLNRFIDYSYKINYLFNESGLSNNQMLFRRAMLAKGDYLLQSGKNKCFCTNDFHRDRSWKRLFRDKKIEELQLVLDEIDTSKEIEKETTNSLEKIINDFRDKADRNDWRYEFIDEPEMFKYCGNNLLIRMNMSKYNPFLLLSSTQTNGYCYEKESLYLYLYLKKQDTKILKNITFMNYSPTQGAETRKYFTIKKEDEEFIITHYNNNWEIYKSKSIDGELENFIFAREIKDKSIFSTKDREELYNHLINL
ncbi:DUF262 domain-containing protein [Miniphocaeibacter halophilus]|uniref:DUF262 domain-containing protein n=1 Tax=Miniphocaeibacter halophilus TaxID=2931922 RepID=A0AC61MMV7_9FIRM|nr:DUF262 domain-containing protein [Miniphocaeibacter halophilus]QQK06951.1 DUF262 domain-containing protein [Miniphocaeibacter halophilus]